MKNFIVSIIAYIAVCCSSAQGQQKYVAEAVLQPDGRQLLKIIDPSGKTTTISGKTNAEILATHARLLTTQLDGVSGQSKVLELSLFVPHQAVMHENGNQEIRWTDAAGKERVVTAAKGESLGEKYLNYLTKEGISCGCTPTATSLPGQSSAAKTATRP